MSKKDNYYVHQCLLVCGNTKYLTWIPTKFKKGNYVEIDGKKGTWFIEETYHNKVHINDATKQSLNHRNHRKATDI